MTTDNFTEAARAEAERRWPRGQADDRPLPAHARMSRRIGFEIGALWTRAHLAAQETDGERAVRELHRRVDVFEYEDDCPDTSDEHREIHHYEDTDHRDMYYCEQMPVGAVCAHCITSDEERADYPCPTIQALDSARAARRDEEKR